MQLSLFGGVELDAVRVPGAMARAAAAAARLPPVCLYAPPTPACASGQSGI